MSIKSKVEIVSTNTFIFKPDPNLNDENNIEKITECIKAILQGTMEYRIVLDIMTPPSNAEEVKKIIDDCMSNRKIIKDLEVSAIDTDGEPLYKKKANNEKSSSV